MLLTLTIDRSRPIFDGNEDGEIANILRLFIASQLEDGGKKVADSGKLVDSEGNEVGEYVFSS